MLINKKQRNYLNKRFKVMEFENEINLETWTLGGVDMNICIDKKVNETLIEQLEQYIDDFDIDSEIDLYREDKDYKNAFTIKESLEDFENWLDYCKETLNTLKELGN